MKSGIRIANRNQPLKLTILVKLRPIFVTWSLMLASIARAGPPFVTDDPEVPPVGGWEINIPFTLQRTPGTTDIQAPLFDLNYGFRISSSSLMYPWPSLRTTSVQRLDWVISC